MKIVVPKETAEGERRVALVPETCAKLIKGGYAVWVEAGAGKAASFSDKDYEAVGASIVHDPAGMYDQAEIVVKVNAPNDREIERYKAGAILVATLGALTRGDLVRRLAERRLTSIALELMPRITRAQKMDVLSAMSTAAGYKAVLIAAAELNRFFPMMMTAAGTITPAKVLVIGAGVAGLQAIATAKRLGAVVEAFDVRPAVKEQVESLGARFVEVDAPKEQAEDAGGYAKEMSEAYKQRQQEVMGAHVKESDVVITTALIPGKPAPKLITAEMVRRMRPNSVIVDLAAEAGGNCELTRPGETVVENGVIILAPTNLPSTVAYHASQMYSRNVGAFILDVTKDGVLKLDNPEDEVTRGVVVTKGGEIVHERVRQAIGG